MKLSKAFFDFGQFFLGVLTIPLCLFLPALTGWLAIHAVIRVWDWFL